MQAVTKSKISELQTILSKMSLEMCCVNALPEFGVRWREVSKAVRNARLPMTSASVARVLCRHVAKSLPMEEVEDIIARLRLKLAAVQNRMWHVIELSERTSQDSVTMLIQALPDRITQAMTNRSRNYRPDVQTVLLGDLMYISIQLVSNAKSGSVLYAAVPPGQPIALVSSLGARTLLKGLVEGLGYKEYQDANLYGRDIHSLLRIHDRDWNENADHLSQIPEYQPAPVITKSGIDYTNRSYNSEYVDNLLGPDPPLLTDLTIRKTQGFFDPSRLNKKMNLMVQLKSDDVAKTLKSWVAKSALNPTSDFFQIFHKIKSNQFTYCKEDSD